MTTQELLDMGKAVIIVLSVGFLFGAGLPALFAFGLSSLYSGQPEVGGAVTATSNPVRVALGWIAFVAVVSLISFGILIIILGKPFLSAVGLI